MKTILLNLLILLLSFSCSSLLYAQEDFFQKSFGRYDPYYEGAITSHLTLEDSLSRTFSIRVYTPPSYTADSTKYPLLVLTDGFYALNMAASIFDLMSVFDNIEEVVIVSLEYPGLNLIDLQRHRGRDMAHISMEGWGPSGQADDYLAFLENQLLPFMKNNYRLNGEKCIYGHSLAGF